jgi:ABC-2 type transport system ATP-binding protein
MIEVSHLKKKYDNFTAVHDLSFEIQEGEVLAIIGPNGAGKSTTLKMICGLLHPDKGTININELDYHTDQHKIKALLGFVPEETAIYEGMTIIDYLMFFGDIYGLQKEESMKLIKQLLKSLQLDEEHHEKPLGVLSKGMKRKVLIARSLINDPDLLIYDEPVSGLDPHTTNFLLNYILNLKKKGKSIIFTAHNLHHVEFVCDKVVMMHKGRVVLSDFLDNVKKQFGEPKYSLKYKNLLTGKIIIKEFKNMLDLNDFLSDARHDKIRIIDIQTEEKTLEEIFLKMTK